MDGEVPTPEEAAAALEEVRRQQAALLRRTDVARPAPGPLRWLWMFASAATFGLFGLAGDLASWYWPILGVAVLASLLISRLRKRDDPVVQWRFSWLWGQSDPATRGLMLLPSLPALAITLFGPRILAAYGVRWPQALALFLGGLCLLLITPWFNRAVQRRLVARLESGPRPTSA
jgi:hypothetical protein